MLDIKIDMLAALDIAITIMMISNLNLQTLATWL